MNILFNAVSQLTGGFINDASTLLTGIIVLGFIAMGLDRLKDVLDGVLAHRASDKHMENARFYKEARDNSAVGSEEYDFNNSLYRRYIRKSADAAERSHR